MTRNTGSSDKSAHQETGRGPHATAEEVEETFREADDSADHQSSVNQVRDEPLPTSHDDDPRQEAVVRNEEHSHASEQDK